MRFPGAYGASTSPGESFVSVDAVQAEETGAGLDRKRSQPAAAPTETHSKVGAAEGCDLLIFL
jgi:hypothetical protein